MLSGEAKEFLDKTFEEQREPLYRYCVRITGNRELALDAVQEAFLKLAGVVELIRSEKAVTSWLRTVARNYCISHFRLLMNRKTESLDVSAQQRKLAYHEDFDAFAAREHIEAALAAVNGSNRPAFILHVFEEESVQSVADELEIAFGTARNRIHRGRLQFCEVFSKLA